MIRDIVKQVKQNPKHMPTVQIPHKYRQVSFHPLTTLTGRRSDQK